MRVSRLESITAEAWQLALLSVYSENYQSLFITPLLRQKFFNSLILGRLLNSTSLAYHSNESANKGVN